jgi:imidazoleglycerol-phosphate dehydratase/histidinol-phosphatase
VSVIRDDLARLEPYRWQEGWEDVVPAGVPVLRLDQNTQPRPPAWYAGAAARLARVPVHSYPDSRYWSLREAIGAYAGFPPEQVIATDGADEALILCALLALSAGDRAYARPPFYAMFESATRLAGGVLADEPDGARLTWLCTPHNPTGEDRPQDAAAAADGGLVVIDQAYLEFGGTDLSHLVRERDDTVVVRTLSKAFAVASARVGYILAPPGLAAVFEAIRPPGSISSHSAALAEMALGEQDEMLRAVAETVAERERMTAALRGLGWSVPDSRTNFLFCDLGEPRGRVVSDLLAAAIVVRTFDALPNHLRITLGTASDNDRVLEALGAAAPRAEPQATVRTGQVQRRTRETRIDCAVALDGTGRAAVTTGIGFLDHMLTALALHSLIDLELTCTGDLWVDPHHTVEDALMVLGHTLDAALGDRAGIARYGDARAPLDEALVHATIDLGGRGYSRVELPLRGPAVGALPVSLVPHAVDTLSRSGRMAIHLEGSGEDDHHVVEAAFKALALALRQAVAADPGRAGALPSTKGAM